MEDRWNSLEEGLRSRLQAGNRAVKWIEKHRYQSIEKWLEAGIAVNELQAAAMALGRCNTPHGPHYKAAWIELGKHLPDLMGLDSGSRAHASWMAANWEAVRPWLKQLEPSLARPLVHPTAIRRRWDAAHRPPMEKRPDTRVGTLSATIIDQQEQIEQQAKTIDELTEAVAVELRTDPNEVKLDLFATDQENAQSVLDRMGFDRAVTFASALSAALKERMGIEEAPPARRGRGRPAGG